MDLAEKKCTTYRAGSPPLTRKETIELLGEVPGWSLGEGHLNRNYELPDAGKCIDFFNEVMNLSMQEGHIPDFSMKESKFITITYYTYPAGGLTQNDFIMAAKLNVKERTPQ
jgi:4a-hydroxytetrahydrobiopterin dehydratase